MLGPMDLPFRPKSCSVPSFRSCQELAGSGASLEEQCPWKKVESLERRGRRTEIAKIALFYVDGRMQRSLACPTCHCQKNSTQDSTQGPC